MRISKVIVAWLPAIFWMVLIFLMSSRQKVQVSDVFTLNFIFFKTLHVIEYAILYFLVFRGFFLMNHGKMTSRMYLYMGIITFIYAVSDELHQTLVPTREGKLRDVIIDTMGMVLMYISIKFNFSKIKKYLR